MPEPGRGCRLQNDGSDADERLALATSLAEQLRDTTLRQEVASRDRSAYRIGLATSVLARMGRDVEQELLTLRPAHEPRQALSLSATEISQVSAAIRC